MPAVAPGTYDLQINVISPDGTVKDGPRNPADLKHDHFTANIVVKMTVVVNAIGVYWFALELAGQEVLRLPLTVSYVSQTDSRTPRPAADGPPSSTPPLTH